MYSNNNGICNNGALPLRHPPQSWCYVEAMQDAGGCDHMRVLIACEESQEDE